MLQNGKNCQEKLIGVVAPCAVPTPEQKNPLFEKKGGSGVLRLEAQLNKVLRHPRVKYLGTGQSFELAPSPDFHSKGQILRSQISPSGGAGRASFGVKKSEFLGNRP